MARPLNHRRAQHICITALRDGVPAAVTEFGVRKQYVYRIFDQIKSTLFFEYELVDGDGNERNFKELRSIFNGFV